MNRGRRFRAEAVPRPSLDFSFERELASYAEVHLEIGAGQGLFAIQHALAHPRALVIAIEQTHVRFARLKGRRERHPALVNLRVFQADAVAFITHFVPAASLDRVHILYPNPYQKHRQSNLRWHNRPFFSHLIGKLKAGGDLILATNLDCYVEEAQARIALDPDLTLIEKRRIPLNAQPRTHFEKKYLLAGQECFNLIARRTCHGLVDHVSITK